MPIREAVDYRHRKIRARRRSSAKTVFYRIRKRIMLKRRKMSLRGMARLSLLYRRRSLLNRRRR